MRTLEVLQKLDKERNAGLYIVGGYVRDLLLGRKSNDIDTVVLNMSLGKVAMFLKEYGKVTKVKIAKTNNIELLLFKAKGDSVEAQVTLPKNRPDTSDVETILRADALERDFTINAMYLPINDINKESIIDLVKGKDAIETKILTTIDDPMVTIRKSPIRILRAVELCARLDFELYKVFGICARVFMKDADIFKLIPAENIQTEFNKILLAVNPSIHMEMLRSLGVLDKILPELTACVGITQNKTYHKHDIYTHCIRACDNTKSNIVLRLSALLHDIGKVPTRAVKNGNISFHKHELESVKLAKPFLERLRYSNVITERVLHLIEHHMYHYTSTIYSCKRCHWISFEKKENKSLVHCPKCGNSLTITIGWSDSAIRRFIRKVGISKEYKGRISEFPLFKLRVADRLGNGHKKEAITPRQKFFERRIEDILSNEDILTIRDLDIDGHVLMELFNMKASPLVGKLLKHLLNLVIEDPKLNNRETLVKEAALFMFDKLS